jgi:hypothetical protein
VLHNLIKAVDLVCSNDFRPLTRLWTIYFVVVVVVFQGLGLLSCSGSEFIFWNLWIYWTVGRTPWTGDRPDKRPLPTQDSNPPEKHRHISMPRVGFEPTIPVFERQKTVCVLESLIIGICIIYFKILSLFSSIRKHDACTGFESSFRSLPGLPLTFRLTSVRSTVLRNTTSPVAPKRSFHVLINVMNTLVTLPALETSHTSAGVAQSAQWRGGRLGFDSRQGQRYIHFATASEPALGPTHPHIK